MVKVPESRCPSCGKLLDAATSITDPGASPSPDDMTICVGCGAILKFDKDLHLQELLQKDYDAIDTEDLLMITKMQTAVIETKRKMQHDEENGSKIAVGKC
jgi:hypothetical protein